MRLIQQGSVCGKQAGGAQGNQTDFITPPNDTIGAISIVFSLPDVTPLPYTVVVNVLPFANGRPVGSGSRASVSCNAQGGGTLVLGPIVAPSLVGVPVMPLPWLLALVLLIGFVGLRSAARRR